MWIKWKSKLTNHYFIVFVSGFIFSFVIMIIMKFSNITFKKSNFIVYYPTDLMVQSDFDIFKNAFDKNQKFEHKKPKADNDDKESLSSLKAALEMKNLKKYDKAMKLFKHALALSPNSETVLTHYGEFIEFTKRDFVEADSYYYRALLKNPQYSKALANRQRTAEIVQNIDEERLRRLDEKRDALSSISENSAALRRVTKEAYIQNIYHSVGIEGNTMTLAETRTILETRSAIGGKSIDEHNEILGLDLAMKFINASLVNKNDYISLKDILEIHKRVLGTVDPIESGVFRKTQVYIGNHIPPSPDQLMVLMDRFEEWMNSDEARSLHPVKLAALAHYKLVHIHPFIDGNGRTSRLLMNTILMKYGFPPVIIQKQQRLQYYNFIQIGNEGDIRPFIRFIADCTEKTLDLFLWATSELSYQVPLLDQQESLIIPPEDVDDDDDDSGNGFVYN